ncbi:unnamed protein product [Trichogramma brassicae]|uniref:Uncharacterized protein n=1 Tax=Trichogramma brassicae TaxID=86971 RepID=A0A6H5I1S2_9HYME|nr:unnamed protein product [Trichogramma brassicae]
MRQFTQPIRTCRASRAVAARSSGSATTATCCPAYAFRRDFTGSRLDTGTPSKASSANGGPPPWFGSCLAGKWPRPRISRPFRSSSLSIRDPGCKFPAARDGSLKSFSLQCQGSDDDFFLRSPSLCGRRDVRLRWRKAGCGTLRQAGHAGLLDSTSAPAGSAARRFMAVVHAASRTCLRRSHHGARQALTLDARALTDTSVLGLRITEADKKHHRQPEQRTAYCV